MKMVAAVLLLSLSLFAADPPKKDASSDDLAKDTYIRESVIKIYKDAWDNRAKGKFALETSTGFRDLLKSYDNLRLSHIETIIRKEDYEVYLIAVPKSELPENLTISYPNKDAKVTPEFFLWLEGNGKDVAAAQLKTLKKTKEQNLKDLEKTGFLSTK